MKPSHPGASRAATVPPDTRAPLPESEQQNRATLGPAQRGSAGVTGLAAWNNNGITDRIVEGRRPSSYFVPVPRPRKRGIQQQLEFAELTADQIEKNQFVNDIRNRVARWRELGRPDVTPTTRRLLEYWTDPERDNPMLFCQVEAAETAIYLAEAAQKAGDAWIRNGLDLQNEEHNAQLNRIALKMATCGCRKPVPPGRMLR